MAKDSNHPHLIRIKQGSLEKIFRLSQDEFTIGRAPSSAVKIDSSLISGEHVRVRIKGNQVLIKDLGSKHGTFISGTKLDPTQEVVLSHYKDEFHLGNIVTVSITPGEANTVTQAQTIEVELGQVAVAGGGRRGPMVSSQPSSSVSLQSSSSQSVAQQAAQESSMPSLRLVTDAQMEAEMLKQGAQRYAQSLKEETRREATQIIHEAKQKKAEVDVERERLEDAITEIKADFEVLNESRSRLEQEIVRSDSRLKAIEGEIEDLKARKEEYEKQLFFAQNRKGEVENETSSLRSKIALIREEVASAERNKQQKLREIEELQATITEIRQSVSDERDVYAKQRELGELELRTQKAQQEAILSELRSRQLSFEGAMGTLEAQKDALTREVQDLINGKASLVLDAEKIKRQAEKDAERAEEKVRVFEQEAIKIKDKIEQHHRKIEELRIETTEQRNTLTHLEIERERLVSDNAAARTRLENSLTSLNEAKSRCEFEVKELKAQVDSLVARRENLNAEYNRLTDEHEKERDEAKVELQRIRAQIRDVQTIAERIRQESDDKKNQALIAESKAATAEEHLLKLQQEISTYEAQTTLVKKESNDLRNMLHKEIQELTAKRDSLKQLTNSEISKQREQLERELAARKAHFDREFEDAQNLKLSQLAKMEEKIKEDEKRRRTHILNEIILGTLAMASRGPLIDQEEDFRQMVSDVVAGKSAAGLGSKAAQRTRLFWKKMGLSALGPAIILLTLAIFPNLISDIKKSISNRADQEKKESGGVFLDEIRARGQVFQPDKMDENYRNTYSDNIIYLSGYTDLKKNDQKQKEWTLILNDFLVGRLGLSDRVIPEFISTEAVMIQNLNDVRKGILPQFKEQGFARMAEIENREVAKLTSMLQGPENYAKFRALEKSFYADYMLSRSDPAKK